MSGGVDSSVSAYLLKKQKYDVAGVTMCLGLKNAGSRNKACCSPDSINDAKKVSRKLDIPHYVFDFSEHLEKHIIQKFVKEYLNGRTPNPCVDCNKILKFDILLKKALSLGFDFLATGHHARIVKKGKNFFLKKAKDKKKDQSYFLYCIDRKYLKNILFPIGGLTKENVREIARKINLPVADKKESQDLCFIPDRDRYRFISERSGRIKKGQIVNKSGKILGEHKGAFFYTIGQRGGLGIWGEHPLYVLSIDTKKNRIVVGKKEELKSRGLIAKDLNMLSDKLPKRNIIATIRYNQGEAQCKKLEHNKNSIKVIFKKEEEAVTPGQSVVFYDSDIVLGGGIIEGSIK